MATGPVARKGPPSAASQQCRSVFDGAGHETLIGLLRRLHENLPMVESATTRYVEQRFPKAARRRPRPVERSDE